MLWRMRGVLKVGLAAGVAVGLAVGGTVAFQAAFSGRMLSNVQIGGQPVGGKTATEARELARQASAGVATLPVTVAFGDRSWETTAGDLGFSYDLDAAVDSAFGIGHGRGPFGGLTAQLELLWQPADVRLRLLPDEGRLEAWIDTIEREVNRPVQQADLEMSGGRVNVLPGQTGLAVDWPALSAAVGRAVEAGHASPIELPVRDMPQTRTAAQLAGQAARLQLALFGPPLRVEFEGSHWDIPAETLSRAISWQLPAAPETNVRLILDKAALRPVVAEVARVVDQTAQDALLSWGDGQLIVTRPSRDTRTVDVDATLEAISQAVDKPERKAALTVAVQPPKLSSANVAALGIGDLVAQGKSNFAGSAYARVVNIRKMAGLLDGVVLAPGEEFSFNRVMGDISPAEGWAEGLVIMSGRTVPGLGGGICQVSTTAFRAAFWAGLPILERHDHAYPVPYYTQAGYPEGFDATVWSPDLDFRFVNDTPAYLLIKTDVDVASATLTVNLYGTKVPGRSVTLEGPFISSVRPIPPARHIIDPRRPKGSVEQTDFPHQGMNVLIKRVVTQGQDEHTDEFASVYQPWSAVYVEGPPDEPAEQPAAMGEE